MNTKTATILLFGALTHLGAHAHEGHGLDFGSHWHATDTLGFIGMAVLVAAVAWSLHKRK